VQSTGRTIGKQDGSIGKGKLKTMVTVSTIMFGETIVISLYV
jgi:hypothetical protein